MGDLRDGKLKPGQSSKKHEVGKREKGKEKAEWLG